MIKIGIKRNQGNPEILQNQDSDYGLFSKNRFIKYE